MGDVFPSVRLAAVQAAPVLLDREATVEKACRLIAEAGADGADLIGFPEGFVPAHPVWFHFYPATSPASMAFSRELFANAVVVPSPATDRLCEAARAADTNVVIGICEKGPTSMGTMFNSLLAIDRRGEILGVRRKIVPTVGERIVHSAGAGDSVRTFATDFGQVSGLMCGENSNPLLTYAMSALGAKVHVASWPSFFNRAADMQAIADLACRAIAYQNSSFVISAVGAIDDAMRERLPATDEDREHLAAASVKGGSAIYAPGGTVMAGPLPGGEGILYAEADLERIVPRKIVHDYAGDYNRFDIFQLVVNVAPGGPPIRLGAAGLNAGDASLPDDGQMARLAEAGEGVLLLGGREREDTDGAPDDDGAPRAMTLRVCTFAGASSLPLLVAQERGLYAAAGLDIELVETRSSDELMGGLRDGRFEIVHAAPDNFIVWRDRRGLPVVAWIGGASGPLLLMGRPGVSSVGDLRGRRIAVDAVASGFVSVLRRMLRDAGLTAEDVTFEEVGSTNLRAEALREGRVDATMLTLPWSAAATRDGFPVLGDGRAAVPRMQGSCAGSLADWLAAEPDVADAYLRAVVAAVTWLQLPDSRQPTRELLSRRYGIDHDLAEIVRAALVDPPLGWPPSALIDPAGMETVCALRTENGDPPKSSPEAYVSLEPYRRVFGFGLLA